MFLTSNAQSGFEQNSFCFSHSITQEQSRQLPLNHIHRLEFCNGQNLSGWDGSRCTQLLSINHETSNVFNFSHLECTQQTIDTFPTKDSKVILYPQKHLWNKIPNGFKQIMYTLS